MALHTAPGNKLFSTTPHALFTKQYESDIRELFAKFQILETSFEKYQVVPPERKPERLKQSLALFRIYWRNVLKTLLPHIHETEINHPRLFMRYGLLHLSDLSEEDVETLSLVALHTEQQNFIFYIDEWFHNIGTGAVTPLVKESAQAKTEKKDKDNETPGSLRLIRETMVLEGVMRDLLSLSKSVATPFLHKKDLSRPIIQQITSREATQKIIRLVRNIDPQVFTRKLLKDSVDLEPYVILVPSYSDFGGCPEAFDRLDRTGSRGHIVIPLYAPDTQHAVLVALANYRWETAKLTAGSYWLEKGLTSEFYDLYRKFSLPGKDEQQAFVAAYCQWILDESRGQICFHPELRKFFWREIPFEQSRRELLVKYFAQFRDVIEAKPQRTRIQ
ncbi:hypothetical protein P0082_11055 [Candidatus Haliotispira prima]|uniref:Uncharacterized protein n=1 Tax=Candidatus Haliotispira prima TaxID=3034016 RepID=A0ABY8MG77_9SPIO|nr:hypothetical protein P0082_11055 [Candidatus Haliotispira prima]